VTRTELARLADDIGTANAVLYVFARLLEKLSFGRARLVKYYLTAQPVHPLPLTPPRRGRQILVREASSDEAMALPMNRPRHVIEKRLRDGGRCLAAYKDGTFVGIQWFTLRDYPEDEVRCLFRLVPDDRCAWDYDIFVLPDWRTQPVFTRLWDACNERLRDAGIELTLSRIHAFNAGSRRAHERIGATVIGWASFLCLGPLQVALFSGRPWVAASISDRGAPTLEVSRMARAAVPQLIGKIA
jgi:GNAT superfamily N-acetyltransferase